MADWKDVMHARHEADDRVKSLEIFAGQIEEGHFMRPADDALALALGAAAICHELRALAVAIDYASTNG